MHYFCDNGNIIDTHAVLIPIVAETKNRVCHTRAIQFAAMYIDTVFSRNRMEYAKFVELSFWISSRHPGPGLFCLSFSRRLSSVSRNGIIIARIQFRDPTETMDH